MILEVQEGRELALRPLPKWQSLVLQALALVLLLRHPSKELNQMPREPCVMVSRYPRMTLPWASLPNHQHPLGPLSGCDSQKSACRPGGVGASRGSREGDSQAGCADEVHATGIPEGPGCSCPFCTTAAFCVSQSLWQGTCSGPVSVMGVALHLSHSALGCM